MSDWKNNRPEKWEKMKEEILARYAYLETVKEKIDFGDGFEAGADAMLGALGGFRCIWEGWQPIKGGSSADAPRFALIVQSVIENKGGIISEVSLPPLEKYIYKQKGRLVFIPEESK